MLNFEYYTPTKVIFGKEAESQVGELVKAQGCKKVLVHYGGQSAKKSGLLDKVFASLTASDIDFVSLGGVVPNPRISKVYEGIELCRKEKVDFILAVGGGSVIDSSKAIGYGLKYDGDVWDFFAGISTAKDCTPIGAVLTISAAGSEMSNSCVITNEDGWLKRGYKSDYARCRFAVLNPELTYSLPAYQVMCGCTDILMHTMERYFSGDATVEITDRIAEGLMKTVVHKAGVLVEKPTDYEANAEIMWASSLSHNGLTGCGMEGDWACHQLEHEIGGMFDVAHGAGLAAVWGSWARYVYKTNPERFAQFAVRVMDIDENVGTPEEIALKGIEAMEEFYRFIGMPVNMKELGISPTEEQLDELAYKCSFMEKRTIGGFQKLTKEDIKKIYVMALD